MGYLVIAFSHACSTCSRCSCVVALTGCRRALHCFSHHGVSSQRSLTSHPSGRLRRRLIPALGIKVSPLAVENVHYEKGWGVFFDVRCQEELHRFSVSTDTLASPWLRQRTKQTFPEIFEANVSTFLQAAKLLIRSGRLQATSSIGGTEILRAHIGEVLGRDA
jgi:hypothetical protein